MTQAVEDKASFEVDVQTIPPSNFLLSWRFHVATAWEDSWEFQLKLGYKVQVHIHVFALSLLTYLSADLWHYSCFRWITSFMRQHWSLVLYIQYATGFYKDYKGWRYLVPTALYISASTYGTDLTLRSGTCLASRFRWIMNIFWIDSEVTASFRSQITTYVLYMYKCDLIWQSNITKLTA